MELMLYAKSISWIDDCRIPFVDENIDFNSRQKGKVYGRNSYNESITERTTTHYNTTGRFPANILVCDDMLNDGVITKQNARKYRADMDIKETSLLGFGDTKDKIQQGDKGTNSRYYDIDKWFDNLLEL